MNLTKLFETQRELDNKIVEEKGLQGQDLLDKKILALQVELGELAQNWRGFKFWSEDRRANVFKRESCPDCLEKGYYRGNPPKDKKHGTHGLGNHWYYCEKCAGFLVIDRNPLLEEYVDCLHFILSIGLEEYEQYDHARFPVNLNISGVQSVVKYKNITKQLNRLFDNIGYLEDCIFEREFGTEGEIAGQYQFVVQLFLGLGEMLGFTWEQIVDAYYKKNEINHERQENGY